MTPTASFQDLKDASVFITGGGSGIGAALTEGFLQQGAKVAFVQRSDASEFCDQMFQTYGQRPLFIACDITNTAALQAAIAQASATHGAVTVLVNNAANDVRHSTKEVTDAFWDQTMAINLKAYFFASQAVMDGMRANGGGAIINFSSISYMMGNAGYPGYTTANAGITGLTRSFGPRIWPRPNTGQYLSPGLGSNAKTKRSLGHPRGPCSTCKPPMFTDTLEPADIVPTALFLASSASKMVTSQLWAVDGGVVVSG